MLVSQAISEIRSKINDKDKIEFTDQEILSYLNDVVQYISAALITYKAPYCIKELEITEPTMPLPSNFAQFCGGYPIKITGKLLSTKEELPITVRYFQSFDDVKLDGEMPFHHIALDKLAVKKACEYAGNQLEMDISQDKALEQELLQVIGTSMGVNV